MDLRQLRCFVMVAETLHFGRAAQRMNMLPASFGRQIRLLEEHLGCQLLKRTTRHVTLSEEGAEFLAAARDIVDRTDALETAFREGRRVSAPTLRIGAIDSAALGLLPQVLPRFREAHPELDIELMEQKTIRLLPRILSGRLDLAVVRAPEAADPALTFRYLFHETAVVAMPDSHRLAGRERVSVTDLANEPLIVPDRRSRPHSHDLSMKLFLDAGLTARVVQIAEEKQTIVSLVGSGVGIAIVPRWTARLAVDGVAFVRVTTPEALTREKLALSLAWARDTRHAGRDAFMQTLEQHLEAVSETA